MALAELVVDDATAIDEADLQVLRDLGLSDPEILDVVLTAAVRCFFSKTLDAMCALPDASFRELEPTLREALDGRSPDRRAVARSSAATALATLRVLGEAGLDDARHDGIGQRSRGREAERRLSGEVGLELVVEGRDHRGAHREEAAVPRERREPDERSGRRP